jgi:hypothetical protein
MPVVVLEADRVVAILVHQHPEVAVAHLQLRIVWNSPETVLSLFLAITDLPSKAATR